MIKAGLIPASTASYNYIGDNGENHKRNDVDYQLNVSSSGNNTNKMNDLSESCQKQFKGSPEIKRSFSQNNMLYKNLKKASVELDLLPSIKNVHSILRQLSSSRVSMPNAKKYQSTKYVQLIDNQQNSNENLNELQDSQTNLKNIQQSTSIAKLDKNSYLSDLYSTQDKIISNSNSSSQNVLKLDSNSKNKVDELEMEETLKVTRSNYNVIFEKKNDTLQKQKSKTGKNLFVQFQEIAEYNTEETEYSKKLDAQKSEKQLDSAKFDTKTNGSSRKQQEETSSNHIFSFQNVTPSLNSQSSAQEILSPAVQNQQDQKSPIFNLKDQKLSKFSNSNEHLSSENNMVENKYQQDNEDFIIKNNQTQNFYQNKMNYQSNKDNESMNEDLKKKMEQQSTHQDNDDIIKLSIYNNQEDIKDDSQEIENHPIKFSFEANQQKNYFRLNQNQENYLQKQTFYQSEYQLNSEDKQLNQEQIQNIEKLNDLQIQQLSSNFPIENQLVSNHLPNIKQYSFPKFELKNLSQIQKQYSADYSSQIMRSSQSNTPQGKHYSYQNNGDKYTPKSQNQDYETKYMNKDMDSEYYKQILSPQSIEMQSQVILDYQSQLSSKKSPKSNFKLSYEEQKEFYSNDSVIQEYQSQNIESTQQK